ncbi:hypothetical protein [Singulisphaera sp. PoT]|uniref:hypothetical protein n=1 Tax=Singulisphaera sp. PoT TaxID=3411797 RepID=UPI003BF602FF
MTRLEKSAAYATVLSLPLAVIGTYFTYLQVQPPAEPVKPSPPSSEAETVVEDAPPRPIVEASKAATPKQVVLREDVQPEPITFVEAPAKPEPEIRDLGSFTLKEKGHTWETVLPGRFSKVEAAFYRGTLEDQTLNAAWAGHLSINNRDVIRFERCTGGNPPIFTFKNYSEDRSYTELNDYRKSAYKPYVDVTMFAKPGTNYVFFYHEQRVDLPMGVVLRITP